MHSYSVDVGAPFEPRGPVPEDHQLEPFLGVAVGLTHDGEQPYAVLVYVHENAGAAGTNAELVRTVVEEGSSFERRPWSDELAVDEIRVEGTTVVARLALRGHPATAYNLLRAQETLAVHR